MEPGKRVQRLPFTAAEPAAEEELLVECVQDLQLVRLVAGAHQLRHLLTVCKRSADQQH